jgi:protein phosphatase
VEVGDRVLLCSDGVHSLLPDTELAALVTAPGPLDDICQKIVEAVKREGGTDNLTVILVEVSTTGPEPLAP